MSQVPTGTGGSASVTAAEMRIPFMGDLSDFEAKLTQAASLYDRFIEDRKQKVLDAVREVFDEMDRRARAVPEPQRQPQAQAPAAAPPAGPGSGAVPDQSLAKLTEIQDSLRELRDTAETIAANTAQT